MVYDPLISWGEGFIKKVVIANWKCKTYKAVLYRQELQKIFNCIASEIESVLIHN